MGWRADALNKGVGVHVTQLKVLTILGLHVVVMEVIHDDLTQMEDDLSKIDRFAHYNLDLSHLAPHQILAEDNSGFEV